MSIVEAVTIVALFTGPISAHVWHKWYDNRKQRVDRKRRVFAALMATRANRMSTTHVDALNAIDIEFGAKDGNAVRDAWHLYLDHLNDKTVDSNNPNAMARWGEKGSDLFLELLYAMSRALGYSFDKVSLKNTVYYPKGHIESDVDQYLLRKYLVEIMGGTRVIWTGVLTGDKPLRMDIVNIPKAEPAPATTQALER